MSGHRFILSVQEINLECQERELVDDLARGLYPPDGKDLPSELGKLCEHMAEVEDDRATEAEQLSWLTMEISNPFQACQLSVFFAPTRYRVVKIACSYSEVVL
jgi:hypothetical protein